MYEQFHLKVMQNWSNANSNPYKEIVLVHIRLLCVHNL